MICTGIQVDKLHVPKVSPSISSLSYSIVQFQPSTSKHPLATNHLHVFQPFILNHLLPGTHHQPHITNNTSPTTHHQPHITNTHYQHTLPTHITNHTSPTTHSQPHIPNHTLPTTHYQPHISNHIFSSHPLQLPISTIHSDPVTFPTIHL